MEILYIHILIFSLQQFKYFARKQSSFLNLIWNVKILFNFNLQTKYCYKLTRNFNYFFSFDISSSFIEPKRSTENNSATKEDGRSKRSRGIGWPWWCRWALQNNYRWWTLSWLLYLLQTFPPASCKLHRRTHLHIHIAKTPGATFSGIHLADGWDV